MGDFNFRGTSLRLLVGAQHVKRRFDNWAAQARNDPALGNDPTASPLPLWDLRDPTTWNRVVTIPRSALTANAADRTSRFVDKSLYLGSTFGFLDDRLLVLGGWRRTSTNTEITDHLSLSSPLRIQASAVTPQVGVLYKLSHGLSIFGSYAKSFVPGSQLLTNPDGTTKPSDPTKGKGFDLGLKADLFDGRVSGTLSFFDIRNQNIVNDLAHQAHQVAGRQGKTRRRGGRLHKLRTLIADDNDVARQLLVQMAHSLGLQPTAVADGRAALQAITQADASDTPFELLLLDWKMPVLDGVACLLELARARLRQPPPAVLMLTTFSHDQVADRLVHEQLTAAATLTKPVTPSTMLEACLQALKVPGRSPLHAERRDEAAKGRRATLAGARILLVEDNAINQELARELLSSAGIDLCTAENGQEALDWLAREEFDLVLMDCQMPVMDGYDATQALRRQPQWRELPVVAMTANAMVGDREKALAAGMNDHVAKPINVDELFATLARWIRRPALAPDRSALPPLDVHAALTGLGGDRRLHRRVMQMFLEQEAAFRDQFAAARAVADTAAMVRLAHDLKSVSGTLHAAGLSEAAAALESACRRGASEQEIDLRFQAVTARLDPVISALRSMPEVSEAWWGG